MSSFANAAVDVHRRVRSLALTAQKEGTNAFGIGARARRAPMAITIAAVAIVTAFANAESVFHHRVRFIADTALMEGANAFGIAVPRAFRAPIATIIAAVAIVSGFANASVAFHHRVQHLARAALLEAASALGIAVPRAYRAHMAIIAAGAILVFLTWSDNNIIDQLVNGNLLPIVHFCPLPVVETVVR